MAELMSMAFVGALLVLGVAVWIGRSGSRRETPSRRGSSDDAAGSEATPSLGEEILALIDEGVVVVGDSLTLVMANTAARTLLGLGGGALPARLPSDDLLSLARRAIVEETEVHDTAQLPSPSRATMGVRAVYLGEGRGALLILRDISEEQLTHRIRRQFVAHASHELKTPVASIQVLAEALRDGAHANPAKAQEFAGRLVQEAERLGRLLGDLLDLSRLEEPAIVSNAVTDIAEIAAREAAEARPQAVAKGIDLRTATPTSLKVRGDAGQLAVMIKNLLDNAIRYTPRAGEVVVEVSSDRDRALIEVRDNGIGIPLRDQARVFERFYRVDEGRSREQGGTGLGLAIVKHVADLHGGRVELTSVLGEGSVFTVTLPLLDGGPVEVSPARKVLGGPEARDG